MSKLIIVCGFPGSGKTTLATELSKKLNIVCLHKDAIKERLYEQLGMSTLEDSKKIGKVSAELMLSLAGDMVANGVDLMIEAPFTFSGDYVLFQKWIDAYDVSFYCVICTAPREELIRRFTSRPRHQSHHDTERNVEAAFDGYDETLYDSLPGKQIRISSDRPVEELAAEVLRQLE